MGHAWCMGNGIDRLRVVRPNWLDQIAFHLVGLLALGGFARITAWLVVLQQTDPLQASQPWGAAIALVAVACLFSGLALTLAGGALLRRVECPRSRFGPPFQGNSKLLEGSLWGSERPYNKAGNDFADTLGARAISFLTGSHMLGCDARRPSRSKRT